MKINWGKGLIIFFILFFIWIFSFVFFALRQNNDLVSDDYYQKGAKYSDQIAIDQRSLPYQDSLQINMTDNQVQIVLSSTLAKADGNGTVELYFFRSSDQSKDVKMSFKNAGSPLRIDKNALSHGRYQVFVSWNHQGEKYMVKKILDLP